jgi:UDP-N-acetylmuramate dehydrogenase
VKEVHSVLPFITELQSASVGEIRLQEKLSSYTTWKIGGPADVMIVPDTKEQLAQAVRILRRHEVPWTVLGRGSNMLVSDQGIRGAVIRLGKGFEAVRFDGATVRVGGAYSFVKLSVLAGKEGLTGLEFAGGIPGTVGGAVYMNAGALGSDVSRILKQAEVLLNTGEVVTMQCSDLQYRYRHSLLQLEPGIVLEAEFQLSYGDRKEIAAAMAAFKDRRLRTQPLKQASAGSVFRNPEGTFAAKLIEEAGLKGMRVGGAEVSPMHANFIVNTGNATAEDVLALMERIQDIVLGK